MPVKDYGVKTITLDKTLKIYDVACVSNEK